MDEMNNNVEMEQTNESMTEMAETESGGFSVLEGCGALALIGGVGYAGYRGVKYLRRKLKERKESKEKVEVVVQQEELEESKETVAKKPSRASKK